MPYIKKERRKALCNTSTKDRDDSMQHSGELNYQITGLVIEYMEKHGHNYRIFDEIEGALSLASKEFYRRVVVPYEDKKIKENGDAYPKKFIRSK